MNRVEMKMAAKQQIKGNIGMLFVCTLIIGAISAAANMIPIVGSLLVTPSLTLGLVIIYLGLADGENVELSALFAGFNQFAQALVLFLLVGIFTFLWSLLFVIPGIIKGLSYSMAFYILAENPGMTGLEALNESKRIMNGHKAELFVLKLSFILWFLLCMVTCGLAMIYVYPYMEATNVNFYNTIKAKAHIGNN